jgi:hypothetical protein
MTTAPEYSGTTVQLPARHFSVLFRTDFARIDTIAPAPDISARLIVSATGLFLPFPAGLLSAAAVRRAGGPDEQSSAAAVVAVLLVLRPLSGAQWISATRVYIAQTVDYRWLALRTSL